MDKREFSRTFIDELRDSIEMRDLVEMYFPVGRDAKIACYKHDERTPSMHVYRQNVYCHGCGYSADAFSFVMDMNPEFSFRDAVEWVNSNGSGVVIQRRKRPAELKSRVPQSWVTYWQSQLTEDRRGYLHKRGLLNSTIDGLGLGWNPTVFGYSVPFYTGIPHISSIHTVQFRSHPDAGYDWRYISQSGYGKPSIINRHLINRDYVLIFFGTFDAILGAQDGLPVISTNGATAFDRSDGEPVEWLRMELINTKTVVIIPDMVASEFESAYRLANALYGDVKFFPRGDWGKDYTDWRMSGHSVEEFLYTVVQMDIPLCPDQCNLAGDF